MLLVYVDVPENMKFSVLPLPLTVTISLPPLLEYEVDAAAPNTETSILSVDEKPEITACSPKEPALAVTIEAISSALPPPEKVSEPATVALGDSNSTVPPPLSTVLLAVALPLMASVPLPRTVVPVAVAPARNNSTLPPFSTISPVTAAVAALTS